MTTASTSGDAPTGFLEGKLFELLGLVNDWLRFAETKNGAVVGFASGSIALMLNTIDKGDRVYSNFVWFLFIAGMLGLLASLIAGLLSFFPRIRPPASMPPGAGAAPDPESENLYYFGHLAWFEPANLAETINHRYFDSREPAIREVHIALARQIVINARIVLWKLRLFSYALVLYGAGVVAIVIGVAIVLLP